MDKERLEALARAGDEEARKLLMREKMRRGEFKTEPFMLVATLPEGTETPPEEFRRDMDAFVRLLYALAEPGEAVFIDDVQVKQDGRHLCYRGRAPESLVAYLQRAVAVVETRARERPAMQVEMVEAVPPPPAPWYRRAAARISRLWRRSPW